MARIPPAELERLKREVAVERLAEARGVRLERHGADLLGLCPFHDDHEPSLVITPAKKLWWAFRNSAISSAASTSSLRRCVAIAQPTTLRLNTSSTTARNRNLTSVGR